MRILVVSKDSGQGAGASQATRYVARRKSDGGRGEEAEATRLFSAHADSLGDHRANLVLGAGSVPPTKDVLHLVISFAHEADFPALGESETERQAAARELTRATLNSASANLPAADLRWVAGIHRNTANPHLHLLIHRDYHDRVSGQTQRLATLPSAWQVRWETTPTGERQTQPGELARTFETLLTERLQRAHSRSGAAHKIAPVPTRSPQSEAPRTADELARLTAQRLLAEARWQTAQQCSAQFAATRHLVRWEIPASATERNLTDQPLIETTLAATERALRWESDQAKFIGKWQVHWDDARRAAAQMRVAELTAQREEIVRRMAAQQADYAERMERQATLLAALSALHAQAVAGFKTAGQPMPSARFTAAELRTLDQLAAWRGDANFYRALTQLEREYDAQPSSSEVPVVDKRFVHHPLTSRAARARRHCWQRLVHS